MRQPLIGLLLSLTTVLALFGAEPTVSFLGQSYRLGSFNQKATPMWEFVSGKETVANWTTLLTVLERPEARTRVDLDRVSEGVLNAYKTNGGKVLMAKTMADAAGTPYNYMVVAFDQPAQHQFELNFVKAALGSQGAYVIIYGARITDARDYAAKAKQFLNEHSSEIGKELEKAAVPGTATWPRRTF